MRGLKLWRRILTIPRIVASFTDAWIETLGLIPCFGSQMVASFTDAWIETHWGRPNAIRIWSHLLQMRGLKLFGALLSGFGYLVASFTDAWIET